MREKLDDVLSKIEIVAATADMSREQADRLITEIVDRIIDIGEVGTDILFHELKIGDLTARKEALLIHILRHLGFRVTKELLPGEHFGYWIYNGESWHHIMPDNVFRDFYLSLDCELEEIMTVEEWHAAVEVFQRQRGKLPDDISTEDKS